MSLFLLMLQLLLALRLAVSANISLPNCPELCGKVNIPYPFGVGDNCYYEKAYEITCDNSFTPPKPFLRKFNVEVLDINWPGRYSILDPRYNGEDDDDLTLTVGLQSPNLCPRNGTKEVKSFDFRDTPFLFSRLHNVFMVEGCGGSAVLKNRSGDILAGCSSFCDGHTGQKNTSVCFGAGCCQASLLPSPTSYYIDPWDDEDLDFYEVSLDFEQLPTSNSCNISATLIESKSVSKFAGKLSSLPTLPTVLLWQGVGYNRSIACKMNPFFRRAPVIGKYSLLYYRFSSAMGLVLLVLGGYWLYKYLKRRKKLKQKANNFKRNGGLLLQQQMSANEGAVERTKVFTFTELEKATDNFNENIILGQGGQGTVYKGMLMDGRIVAIKKSKKVDESQVEPFINEVVILSQINHRNVVGLLGCCLETEVPTLVYEYIPNGTLYEHIQGAGDDFHINWKMRLQIAAESAGAVAYLHSSSAAPIYHRDIKSTNILLDEKYRAKVSDFGTSRAINIEQTHVTTAVQGTYGYLDPEYFQSNQFTEKSDVYSFGVVLVELLTGKKPICPVGNGGWISLAVEFLSKMEDSRLFDILDCRISDEGKEDEFMAVAELARKCLNMNGKQRPTMKEIAVQLDAIGSSQMPISKEVKSKECNHAVTEATHFDSGPVNRSMFTVDDDPPPSTIEVQPLMGST
ncbi:putative wall-associated receptor kinase-like 11 [Silene latifolia]|uniref:putative wall-associated receptor kinase-like 11 n=1 Tax=Silene latifolia TaxID=37657 RepID=UPI003D77BD60